jgi:predicted nucleic acid-binding protein
VPGLVLDASVALAAVLPDEADAALAGAMMTRVADEAAVVPALWHIEVGNGLLVQERRGRLMAGMAKRIIRHLQRMPIMTDAETSLHAWDASFALAAELGLTLYDACYLELAIRVGLPLASFDGALRRAAVSRGVGLL